MSGGVEGGSGRGPAGGGSHRLNRFFANAFLLTCALMITVGLAELFARVYLEHFAAEATFRRYASFVQLTERYGPTGRFYAPHPYLRFYPTPGYTSGANRHNSLGYRGEEIGPKADGEYRIVCLGGSTTYTNKVSDYRLSYPHLLQETLAAKGYDHVRVINSGVPGWTTWQTLINLQFRVLDLDPDLIIVYHAVNDIAPRMVWPPEAYRGDNSGWLAADFWLGHRSELLDKSTLLRMLRIRLGRARPQNELNWLDPQARTAYALEFDQQLRRDEYPSGLFDDISVQRMLEINEPAFYRRNLEHLVTVARSRDLEVVLATFAHLKRGPKERLGSHYSQEFFSAIAEANEIVHQIGAESDALVFDFAAAFPDDTALYANVLVDGEEHPDPYHVNAKGAVRKAALFAEFLIESVLPVPARPDPQDPAPVANSDS